MNTPAQERNYEQGALYFLQLTNNKFLYRNIVRDVKRHREFIEFKIKRYLQFRLQAITHSEVQEPLRNVIFQLRFPKRMSKALIQALLREEQEEQQAFVKTRREETNWAL